MKNQRALLSRVPHVLVLLTPLYTLPAMAVLNTPINLRLIAPGGAKGPGFTDPTPVDKSQSFSYAAAVNSGSGMVGSLFLPKEQVFLIGNSIRISSYTGDDTGGVYSTGWLGLGAAHARYEFTDLAIAGHTITGFTLSGFDGFGDSGFQGAVTGTTGVSMVDTNADGSLDKLSFNLDTLRFVSRPLLGTSEFHADFRIDLVAVPVPELGTFSMALAGLMVLSLARVARRPGRPVKA